MKLHISKRITTFREYKNLTQSKFSKIINASRSTISQIEHGKDNIPSTSIIIDIIENFNELNIEWLLTGRGEMINNGDNTHKLNIEKITEEIEKMNFEERCEIMQFINEKKQINEIKNLIIKLSKNI